MPIKIAKAGCSQLAPGFCCLFEKKFVDVLKSLFYKKIILKDNKQK
jgi:hypothetical protein